MFRRIPTAVFSSRFFSTAEKKVKIPKAAKEPKVPKEPKKPKVPKEPKDSNVISRKILVEEIATSLNVPKTTVDGTIGALLSSITNYVMKQKKSVRFVNFGSFILKEQAARSARNPKNGETLSIPAKTKLSFKPSKSSPETSSI